MCKQTLDRTVYLCRHMVESPGIVLPHDGCGGCGTIKATGYFGQTTKRDPCPDCIANGIYVKVSGKWQKAST